MMAKKSMIPQYDDHKFDDALHEMGKQIIALTYAEANDEGFVPDDEALEEMFASSVQMIKDEINLQLENRKLKPRL